MMTTDEVARRLGVKPATVYAYVSRGLLTRLRNGDGKGSIFDPAEVEAFAVSRRGASSASAPAIHTGITLIRDGRLFFRGRDVAELARTQTYEAVATLLWTGELDHVPLVAPADAVALGQAVTAPLPAPARLTDRLRVIVAAAAAADPLRFDTTPAAVTATARALIATMVAALPLRAGHEARTLMDHRSRSAGKRNGRSSGSVAPGVWTPDQRPDRLRSTPLDGGLAAALWSRLTEAVPTPQGLAALNAALVLLADHDIAASTLAARVAASTRAHPYAVVGAGLAALDGPLHGAASGLAYEFLTDAIRDRDPLRTLSDRLRVDGVIAGFRHGLYPDGDPRATALLGFLREAPPGPAHEVVDQLVAAMLKRSEVAPNIDFAIAALTLLYGMSADAGEAIFAIARTSGWIAHALEEYSDRPSRFRPNGLYAGRGPSPGNPGT
jgi:citrate synthase